uniref:RNase H type-1 domain-containing protein n=1 Tax=Ditylenchus dipsaci TaxID=166011 RepID=A0A915EFA0_9BILA
MTKRTFHFECAEEEDEIQVGVKFQEKGPQQEPLPVDIQKEETSDLEEIVIYTDGSVIDRGFGKESGIGIFVNDGHPLNKSVQLLSSHGSTMTEILAIITALKDVKEWCDYKQERIIIKTDDKNLVTQLRSGSFGSLASEIHEIYTLARSFPNGVIFQHVQGHAGNPGNEQADTLARAAIGLPPCRLLGFIKRVKHPLSVLITPESPESPFMVGKKTDEGSLSTANEELTTSQANSAGSELSDTVSLTDTPKKYKKNDDTILKLIELVSKQPCLYNSNVQGNQFVAWREVVNQLAWIAKKVLVVCNTIKSLWKSKLEVFVKEYNRFAEHPQEDQHQSAICPYYNELDWIEPYLARKVADGEPANEESPKMVLTSQLRPSKVPTIAPSSHSQYKRRKRKMSYSSRIEDVESFFEKEITSQLRTLPQDVKIEAETNSENYVAGYRMDNSDLEWKLFRKSVFETITTYALHSVHVLLTTTITFYTKTQVCAWISCLVFVVKAGVWAPFSSSPNNYYREFNMYLYTSIQILNFCIYLAKQRNQGLVQINFRLTLDYLEYLLYPMYSTALIVLFEDFHQQYESLRNRIGAKTEKALPSVRCILCRALRLIFWFYFLELALHFCHVNAFFNSPFTMLKGLHNYEKASIAYIAGQFFHIKYVLIFGIPRLFASIDGFSPPGPPICISRVSKYSLMWRHFDQGLYQFLKNQVYIPLLGSSSNPQISTLALMIRRFLSMVCVFLFVLSWHGPSSTNYLSWVCLSALELCIERNRTTKHHEIDSDKYVGDSDAWYIWSVFFLSQAGVGSHIFFEVLVKGLFGVFVKPWEMKLGDPGFVMLHLLILGYCFNCVCIYLEHKYRKSETSSGTYLKKNE